MSAKNDNETDDEVGEGFVVRGGVMMRIADLSQEKWKPVKRFYIDVSKSQIYQDARIREASSSDEEPSLSRVTVELSALPGDGRIFHLRNNLPGIVKLWEIFILDCSEYHVMIFFLSIMSYSTAGSAWSCVCAFLTSFP